MKKLVDAPDRIVGDMIARGPWRKMLAEYARFSKVRR